MRNLLKTRTSAFAIVLFLTAAAAVTPARAADPVREAAGRKSAVVYSPTETRYISRLPERSTNNSKRRWKKAWIASWVAFAAVNLLDAHSSSGRRELNPLLRNNDGTFSNRKAALMKSAIGGGFFAVQWWIARKNPHTNHYKAFSIATGAAAAGLGVVAASNYGVRKVAQQDLTSAAHPFLRTATVATR